jgi:hypothetical protein
MMIGDETYGRLTPDKARKIIRELNVNISAKGDRK